MLQVWDAIRIDRYRQSRGLYLAAVPVLCCCVDVAAVLPAKGEMAEQRLVDLEAALPSGKALCHGPAPLRAASAWISGCQALPLHVVR